MDYVKITVPSLAEGQTGWRLQTAHPPMFSRLTRPRTLWDRIVYSVLRRIRDRAERLESWCYHKSVKHQPDFNNSSLVVIDDQVYGYPTSVTIKRVKAKGDQSTST